MEEDPRISCRTQSERGALYEFLRVPVKSSFKQLILQTAPWRVYTMSSTKSKVYKICYSHLDQGNIPMVTQPVPSVTRGCNHKWHPRKILLNLPLQMDL